MAFVVVLKILWDNRRSRSGCSVSVIEGGIGRSGRRGVGSIETTFNIQYSQAHIGDSF